MKSLTSHNLLSADVGFLVKNVIEVKLYCTVTFFFEM